MGGQPNRLVVPLCGLVNDVSGRKTGGCPMCGLVCAVSGRQAGG